MKKIFYAPLLSVAVLMFSSCSDSDSPTLASNIYTPNSSGFSSVKSISRSGVFDDSYDWDFYYRNDNMIEAYSRLATGISGQYEGKEIYYKLKYGTRDVTVRTNGDAVDLILQNALVSQAVSGNTTYSYNYSMGYLTSWNVIYKNSGFGEETTKGASSVITWNDGNISSIVYIPSADASNKFYTYTFQYSNELNYNGLMPEVASRALGCFGLEYLYYSGMLGRGTKNLVKSVTVENSMDPDDVVTYTFNYRMNAGNVVMCSYGTAVNPVIVTYGY